MSDSTELKRAVLAQHLRRHVEGEVRFDPTSRRLYSTDGSIYRIEPLGVVGPRTIVYGKTIDHVRRLAVVLADGSRADFGPLTAEEWDKKASQRSFEGDIYRGVRQTVRDNAEEIGKRFPRILRRVSGYNLDR